MNIFDYIFQEACRVCRDLIGPECMPAKTLCKNCWEPLASQEAQLESCPVIDFGFIPVAYAATYEKTLKLLIYKLKYDSDRLIAHDLGLLLQKALVTIQNESVKTEAESILVPVPLSHWRLIKRGFNQAELLAKQISKKDQIQISANLLKRKKHTKAQHKLNKHERAANLQDAFACAKIPFELKNKRIILIDDIHTSGATLAEAAHTLFLAGANSVSAITVARAILQQSAHD